MTHPNISTVASGGSVLLALGLALAAPAPATAQDIPTVIAEMDDVVTTRVPYGDLNLASSDGQKTLDRRVFAATRKVCVYERGSAAGLGERACRRDAYERAQPQIAAAIERARNSALALAAKVEVKAH